MTGPTVPVVGGPTVLVVGPALSGAGAVAAALRHRLTGCQVGETASGPPDVVVFVVSAAAPIAECDAALLDAAAVETDAVVAVVAKTDVHRTWPGVLEANRAILARHASRYGTTPWVGVAAAPRFGEPVIDPLVDAVRAVLADGRRMELNALRAARVRAERAALRQAQAARGIALRAQVRAARLELTSQARARAVSLRSELLRQAASASRRGLGRFDGHVRSRVSQTAGGFDDLVHSRFAEICRGQGLSAPDFAPAPRLWDGLPAPHRPAGDSATVVFAAAFGLGMAMTLGRLLVELAGVPVTWALAGCGPAGVALAVWVVRSRRLTACRLASERWVAEVCSGLRSALEDRVLAAESSLLAATAAGSPKPN